jgi:hypothetical protein
VGWLTQRIRSVGTPIADRAVRAASIRKRFLTPFPAPCHRKTWSQHLGLDYDLEQKNLAVHRAAD